MGVSLSTPPAQIRFLASAEGTELLCAERAKRAKTLITLMGTNRDSTAANYITGCGTSTRTHVSAEEIRVTPTLDFSRLISSGKAKAFTDAVDAMSDDDDDEYPDWMPTPEQMRQSTRRAMEDLYGIEAADSLLPVA